MLKFEDQIKLQLFQTLEDVRENGRVMPAFLFYSPEMTGVQHFKAEFADLQEKANLHHSIKQLLVDRKAEWYICKLELWVTEFVGAVTKYNRVAEMPLDDRVEVAAVAFNKRGGQPRAYVAEIKRRSPDSELGDWEEVKLTEHESFGMYQW